MAQLTVKINGYAYTIACEDGQEQHLQNMAAELDSRVERAKAVGGSSGEGRLLVVAALLMADELHDMHVEMSNLREQLGGTAVAPPAAPAPRPDAKRIARIARKAEDIAAGLEQP